MDKEADTNTLTVERLIDLLKGRDPQALVALGGRKEAPGELSLITIVHKDGEVFSAAHEVWRFIKSKEAEAP